LKGKIQSGHKAFDNKSLFQVDMDMFAAAILGIIQGLTEFLPISSSAHLLLVPWFLGWNPEGMDFDVALHVGTALSVIAFFWKDWILLARETIIGIKEKAPFGNSQRRLAWFLVVGTIPALILGLSFEKRIEAQLRSPLITVFTLAIFGLLLLYAEKKSRQNRTIENYTWMDSISIGFSQAIALIPGVSRSGITISTAMLRDSDRTNAARFSFLLSTPVIVGAGLLKGLHLAKAVLHPVIGAAPIQWTVLGVGTLTAALTGFLCIKFFLSYLRSRSFLPFAIYRFFLAGLVLFIYLSK
jgi:undecaprenyl-diphosphatase